MLTELLIVTALLAAHGLFSGAEIAILSIRKTRLHEFVRRRDKRALAVKALRDHPELRGVSRLTLLQSFRCVRLVLWDEGRQRLISFREMGRRCVGDRKVSPDNRRPDDR